MQTKKYIGLVVTAAILISLASPAVMASAAEGGEGKGTTTSVVSEDTNVSAIFAKADNIVFDDANKTVWSNKDSVGIKLLDTAAGHIFDTSLMKDGDATAGLVSPATDGTYTLKSGTSYTYKSTDASKTVNFAVKKNASAPKITFDGTNANAHVLGTKGSVVTPKVTVEAAQGVKTQTLTVNGTAVKNGATYTLSHPGLYAVQVSAEDNLGNTATAKYFYDVSDLNDLRSHVTVSASEGIFPTGWNANQSAYTVYVKSGSQASLSLPDYITVNGKTGTVSLGEGTYSVTNGVERVSFRVVTDTQGPSISVDGAKNGQTISNTVGDSVKLNYTTNDSGSGVKSTTMTVDGKEVPNGYSLDTKSAKIHDVEVTSTDNAGNVSTFKVTYKVSDMDGLKGDIKFANDKGVSPVGWNSDGYLAWVFKGTTARLKLKSSESVNGQTVDADGTWHLTEGKYTVTNGVDNVTVIIQTDFTSPEVTVDKTKDNYVESNGTIAVPTGDSTFSITSDDTQSGVSDLTVTLDGNAVDNAESFDIPKGIHKVAYSSTDKVGNVTNDEFMVNVTDDASQVIDGTVVNPDSLRTKGGVLYHGNTLPRISFKLKSSIGAWFRSVSVNGTRVAPDADGVYTVTLTQDGKSTIEVHNFFGKESTLNVDSESFGNVSGGPWDSVSVSDGKVSMSNSGAYTDAKGKPWYNAVRSVNGKINVSTDFTLPLGKATATANNVDTPVTINSDATSVALDKLAEGIIPGANGALTINLTVSDVLGVTKTAYITVYVDNTAPQVTNIIVQGADSGKNTGTNGRYVFIFKNSGKARLAATDPGASSGIQGFRYTWYDVNGTKTGTGSTNPEGNIDIPEGFRGYIGDVVTVDNVANVSDKAVTSDGIISETVRLAQQHNAINISLPNTPYRDAAGRQLYNSNVNVGVESINGWSGLNSANLSIGGSVKSSWSADKDGNSFWSGLGNKVEGIPLIGNLVSKVRGQVNWSAEGNGQDIAASVTDNAGFSSSATAEISIDKTSPVIGVTWNETNGQNIYNHDRIATITVKDVNLSPVGMTVKGGVFSGWHSIDGTTMIGTVSFSADTQTAQLTVEGTDLAGNVARPYTSENFIIDKTAPQLTVSGNGTPRNSNYFNINRVFTITVVDMNVDPSNISVTGGTAGGWSNNGNRLTGTVQVSGDGEHQIGVSVADKAGNKGNTYDSGKFIQDTEKPKVVLNGVNNGASYSGDVQVSATASDKYLDMGTVKASVNKIGGKNEGLKVSGAGSNATTTKLSIMDKKDNDGYYKASAVATDMAGNTSDVQSDFIVDRFGGQYNFLSTDYAGKYLHNTNDIVLTVTSYDKLDTNKSRIIVTRNGKQQKITTADWKVVESGGTDGKPYIYTYTVSKKLFKEDGVYRIMVYSCTVEGIWDSSASIDYTFVIDNTAPEVSIYGVGSGENVYSASKKVPVTISARDSYGVKSGDYSTTQDFTGSLADGEQSVTYLTNGNNITVKAVAVDKAGNKSVTEVSGVSVYSSLTAKYIPWIAMVGVLLAMGITYLFAHDKEKNAKELRKALK